MQWSPQQDQALQRVAAWLKEGEPQVFRLFGYAGTGKTTLARHLAEGIDGKVVFAAYTGKAALMLRRKRCRGASTIHSLIYETRDSKSGQPTFVLNQDSYLKKAKLAIIDECSMVDEEVGRDLLSFGTPILVLGDPEQLPPIKGGGFFTEAEPDMMLTEVHRQAADNPIIRMSMDVREGGTLDYGTYGESRIIRREQVGAGMALGAGQILVGIHRTRRTHNARMRSLLKYAEAMPMVGDKLVCLRNDRSKGLLNGGIWRVDEILPKKAKPKEMPKVHMTVRDEDRDDRSVDVSVLQAMFGGGEEIAYAHRRGTDEFDFGYALTVHKAQGSQWDDVLLFDESWAFREHRSRWLYTGLTRAAEKVTVVM